MLHSEQAKNLSVCIVIIDHCVYLDIRDKTKTKGRKGMVQGQRRKMAKIKV